MQVPQLVAQRVVFDHHPSLNTAELSDRRSLQWLASSLSCHRRRAAALLPELAQRTVAPALLPSQPVPTPLCVHLLRPCHDHHRRRCQRKEGGEGISRRQGDTLCEHTRRAWHLKRPSEPVQTGARRGGALDRSACPCCPLSRPANPHASERKVREEREGQAAQRPERAPDGRRFRCVSGRRLGARDEAAGPPR